MAQIPTSSITMGAIATELGISTSSITLDNCRANSNAFVMSATDVPGHTRDGNEQTNTNASPWYNTMAEWAGYIDTQGFDSPTYYVRTGTTTAAYCNYQTATAGQTNEPIANAHTIYYVILNDSDSNNNMLEFYMVPDHLAVQTVWIGATETAVWYNTSSVVQSYSGNFSSGFTPVKIAELNVGPSGEFPDNSLNVQINTGTISGSGYFLSSYSGYSVVNNGAWFAPSSTKKARIPRSFAEAACNNSNTFSPYHTISFSVRGTGYNTQTVGTFVNRLVTSATSNNCQ